MHHMIESHILQHEFSTSIYIYIDWLISISMFTDYWFIDVTNYPTIQN